MRNYHKLLIIILALFLLLFFSASNASAKAVTFEKEYTYQASEIDSKVSSRAIALEQVKRLLLEELGVYLISETEVKDFKLTKDQVTVLTAGIVSAEILQEKWDGVTYYMKAKISADPDEVAKSVKTIGADKQKTKELEDSRKKAKDALEEIERLKKEIAGLKQSTKQQKEYATAVKELSATDWFEKGLNFGKSGNYKEEINSYNKAIELNPQYTNAYYNRGNAYSNLGNYQQAINDYNKAIQLNPQDDAYVNRGNAYSNLGNYQQAINDYNKAIQLNPKDTAAYNNRGVAYADLGNYQQAINDYNKAIQLNPKNAAAYKNRGKAYAKADNEEKALEDIKIAAKLGDKQSQDLLRSLGIETEYYSSQGQQQEEAEKKGLYCKNDIDACERIGLNYYKTGEYDKAIEIFSEMIGLRPLTTSYFVHRGNCYLKKGDNASAISDFKYAASKGDTGARNYLEGKGISW